MDHDFDDADDQHDDCGNDIFAANLICDLETAIHQEQHQ